MEAEACWFCGEAIGERRWNKHHLIPQRYLRNKKAKRDERNLVMAHISCHSRFHRRYDRVHIPMVEYIFQMHGLNFGRNVFATEGPNSAPFSCLLANNLASTYYKCSDFGQLLSYIFYLV